MSTTSASRASSVAGECHPTSRCRRSRCGTRTRGLSGVDSPSSTVSRSSRPHSAASRRATSPSCTLVPDPTLTAPVVVDSVIAASASPRFDDVDEVADVRAGAAGGGRAGQQRPNDGRHQARLRLAWTEEVEHAGPGGLDARHAGRRLHQEPAGRLRLAVDGGRRYRESPTHCTCPRPRRTPRTCRRRRRVVRQLPQTAGRACPCGQPTRNSAGPSRTCRVPRTRPDAAGRGTDAIRARCRRPSRRRGRRHSDCAPGTMTSGSMTRACTSAPRDTRAATARAPMKPVAPVTRTRGVMACSPDTPRRVRRSPPAQTASRFAKAGSFQRTPRAASGTCSTLIW